MKLSKILLKMLKNVNIDRFCIEILRKIEIGVSL